MYSHSLYQKFIQNERSIEKNRSGHNLNNFPCMLSYNSIHSQNERIYTSVRLRSLCIDFRCKLCAAVACVVVASLNMPCEVGWKRI